MDTHALYLKHLASIGCPDWNACPFAPAGATICITFFLGSDGGPDEVGAKMQAMYESIPDPPTLRASCSRINACFTSITSSTGDTVCHTLRKFQTADRRYFSSLVKILHTWRDTSKKMKYVWTAKYGQQAASQVCTGRVPIAMSGRWGATSKGEEFLLRGVSNDERSQQFRQVCSVVWTSAKNPQAKAGVATREEKRERLCDGHVDDGDGLTELAVEAMEAGDCQKGQVEGQLPACSQRRDFSSTSLWQCCTDRRSPCNTSCTGLSRLPSQLRLMGSRDTPGKMALLCWGKAEAFLSEQEALADVGVLAIFPVASGREHALCFERMHPLGYSPTPCRLQLARRHHDSLSALQFVHHRQNEQRTSSALRGSLFARRSYRRL